MRIDLHLHTAPRSPCSVMDPEDAVREAARQGLRRPPVGQVGAQVVGRERPPHPGLTTGMMFFHTPKGQVQRAG